MYSNSIRVAKSIVLKRFKKTYVNDNQLFADFFLLFYNGYFCDIHTRIQ